MIKIKFVKFNLIIILIKKFDMEKKHIKFTNFNLLKNSKKIEN